MDTELAEPWRSSTATMLSPSRGTRPLAGKHTRSSPSWKIMRAAWASGSLGDADPGIQSTPMVVPTFNEPA
eukprot:CAMPEP_0194749854 /NCGR_PEP_ID=MMETSP0323_2-20130528/3935_1 /TAXON_ID=2866 ORGANISM="Crypthecodinium cohnii, Strain Seligo" /NCGR_SAMPLE_ID=MMETSP0323_2 /ASSEMBLY_ACC=CAM_ASM_000346 /LENGTH=70 /DNA_ID=CAMNT_0039665147 /DNA_START=707 /DNA_END=916 /DNA_ORIENTATION=+